EQWMDDVRIVMEAARSERAALLGYGDGGQMAMLFAATYPERTSALILADTFAWVLRDVDYPWGLRSDRVPRWLHLAEKFWGTGTNVDLVAPSLAHHERLRRWYARFDRLAMSPPPFTAPPAHEYAAYDRPGARRFPERSPGRATNNSGADARRSSSRGPRVPGWPRPLSRRAHPRRKVRGAAR